MVNKELLIELVHERVVLWDQTDGQFFNRDVRSKRWEEVGKKLNIEGDEARKQWELLRDMFRKKIKELRRVSGTTEKPKWKYFDALSFLTPMMKTRATRSGNSGSSKLPVDTLCIQNLEEQEIEFQLDYQSDDSARIETPEPSRTSPHIQNSAKRPRICINKEMDETKNFSNDELQRLVLLEQLQLYRLKNESDETKNLNNQELQRLVLLEQLQVYRLKKEKLSLEIAQYNKKVKIDADNQ